MSKLSGSDFLNNQFDPYYHEHDGEKRHLAWLARSYNFSKMEITQDFADYNSRSSYHTYSYARGPASIQITLPYEELCQIAEREMSLSKLVKQEAADAKVRDNVHAVKSAYEHYQMLLALNR